MVRVIIVEGLWVRLVYGKGFCCMGLVPTSAESSFLCWEIFIWIWTVVGRTVELDAGMESILRVHILYGDGLEGSETLSSDVYGASLAVWLHGRSRHGGAVDW